MAAIHARDAVDASLEEKPQSLDLLAGSPERRGRWAGYRGTCASSAQEHEEGFLFPSVHARFTITSRAQWVFQYEWWAAVEGCLSCPYPAPRLDNGVISLGAGMQEHQCTSSQCPRVQH